MNQLPLADIHVSSEVASWPLAIGWWLLGAFAISLLALLTFWLVKQHRLKRFSKKACRYLKSQESSLDLQAINELLKVTALHYSTNPLVAGLTGAPWREWLIQHTPKKQQPQLTQLSELLAELQYSAQQPNALQQQAMSNSAQLWLANAWRIPKLEKEASR